MRRTGLWIRIFLNEDDVLTCKNVFNVVARKAKLSLFVSVIVAMEAEETENKASNDRGFSFERNCVLHRWESETLK